MMLYSQTGSSDNHLLCLTLTTSHYQDLQTGNRSSIAVKAKFSNLLKTNWNVQKDWYNTFNISAALEVRMKLSLGQNYIDMHNFLKYFE